MRQKSSYISAALNITSIDGNVVALLEEPDVAVEWLQQGTEHRSN
jgi:hypothetical protein